MSNYKFKKAVKRHKDEKNQFHHDKQRFIYDVKNFFMEKYNLKVSVLLFKDTFGVDPYFTDTNPKLSLKILCDFCDEFGCDFEYTNCDSNRYIFSFNNLTEGYENE